MVFSGRPSTACHACRPKRLKCDRDPSGCSQCRRKRHDCPGYPDPWALRMRHETARITSRQEARSKSRSKRSPSPSRDASSPCSSEHDEASPLSKQPVTLLDAPSSALLLTSLPTPFSLDQRAIAYLFNTFISATPFEGYLASFHGPCSGGGSSSDDACSWAVDATALAAYARHARLAPCQDAARAKYAGALARVNAALADPGSALQDRTLVAVLVLALFEAVVFQGGRRAPTSWAAHTWGAMQLLMLRGAGQFSSSPTARQLFEHASANVKAGCIQRSIAIPQPFLEFDDQVRAALDQHDPSVRMARLLSKVSAIKASVQDPHRTAAMAMEAINVDQELVDFCKTPPLTLRYTREPLAQGPGWTYQRIVHRYPDMRVAKVWNAVRLLRIFLLSYIGDDITHFPIESNIKDPLTLSSLRIYALENMADVSADVLASIPCFVHSDGTAKRFLAPARCLGWPLGILEKSSICPAAARIYSRKTLEWLAQDLNLPQAIHPDRHPGSREDWLHLFHVG